MNHLSICVCGCVVCVRDCLLMCMYTLVVVSESTADDGCVCVWAHACRPHMVPDRCGIMINIALNFPEAQQMWLWNKRQILCFTLEKNVKHILRWYVHSFTYTRYTLPWSHNAPACFRLVYSKHFSCNWIYLRGRCSRALEKAFCPHQQGLYAGGCVVAAGKWMTSFSTVGLAEKMKEMIESENMNCSLCSLPHRQK